MNLLNIEDVSRRTLTAFFVPNHNHHQPYKQSLDNLKNHIDDLANPCLAEAILQKFNDISEGAISFVNGISYSFSNLALPTQTKKLIQELHDQILSIGSSQPSELDKLSAMIKTDFSQIAKDKRTPDFSLWEELKILFNLSQIITLRNDQTKKILNFINEKKIEELKNCILNEFCIDENGLNKSLKEVGYKYKIKTLLSQVINKKPEKNDGIFQHWNREESFFNDKTFELIHQDSNASVKGVITKCLRNLQNQSLRLTLHDTSEVEIPASFTPTLIRKFKYDFWDAISRNHLDNNEEFILETQPDMQVEKGIKTGAYLISFPDNADIYKPWYKQFVTYISDTLNKKAYRYIELITQAQKKAFLLQYELNSALVDSIHIYRWSELKDELKPIDSRDPITWKESATNRIEPKGYEFIATYSPAELKRLYYITKITQTTLNGVNKNNANQCIQIKDEGDDTKIKLIKLEEIKEQINSLRAKFLKEENQQFLNELIENLIKNQLSYIDMELLSQNTDFKTSLEEISHKYRKDVNEEYTPLEILRTIVLDANYAILVNKEQSVVVSRTMELLKTAYQHIHKMDGKDIILFMGNTGSGKSTAVSYFLGLDMDSFFNRVGDKVIQIKSDPTKQAEKSQPKIGQSLGNSETLYTQGYPIPDYQNIMLGDCPGFNDTRGRDYEMCTNLSIDEAVSKVKAIRSIVMIIPIHAFLMDRANPVIDLIEVVKERFPNLLSNKQNVFILITKSGQVPSETANGMKEGKRIDELLSEAIEKKKALSGKIESGADNRDFELVGLLRRLSIWQSLQTMYQNKKIHFIDVENEEERDEILKKYTQSQGIIDKTQYIPAMQGSDMQAKFGKYVEMATHTWTLSIIERYLNIFPQLIQKSNNVIAEKKQKIANLNNDIELNQKELTNLMGELTQSEEIIFQLENALQNGGALKEELLIALKKRIEEAAGRELDRLNGEIQRLESKLSENNTLLQQITSQIENTANDKISKKLKQTELEMEIEILKKDSTTLSLWSFKPAPQEMVEVTTIRDVAVKVALFNEMKSNYDPADVIKRELHKAIDYRGTLWYMPKIEKSFKLIPANEEARNNFKNLGSSAEGAVGTHTAYVDGKHFEFDLGRKADPTGKVVMYSFSTFWEGNGIPWIDISHKIPNIDINAATIINKENEIDLLRKNIDRLTLDLNGDIAGVRPGKLKEKNSIEANVCESEMILNLKVHEFKELKQRSEEEQLSVMVQSQQETKTRIVRDIEIKRSEPAKINAEIEGLEKEKEAEEIQRKALQQSKRHLAVIIHEQHEVAKQLRDFAALVVGNNKKLSLKGTNSTISTCQNYIDVYDTNITKLKEECEKDLGFFKKV